MSDNYLDQLALEDAIKTLAARAEMAGAMADNLPSPCVNVCSMDEDTRMVVCKSRSWVAKMSRIIDVFKLLILISA